MPGIRLEITVDDKGTPVVRQFNQEVSRLPSTTDEASQSTQRFANHSRTLGESLGQAARNVALYSAAYLGAQGVFGAVNAAATALRGFEDRLANTNTLIPGQIGLQRQLRDEIIKLPGILGTTTELASGLYDVLSAGIRPAEAVQFLGTSAELARAGLASLDTSTTALTKTLQVYGLQANDARMVSDVLFQTVNLGQGTLEQFAGAFPNVLTVSKSLGVSFQDASAALATLSNAFRSPSEAATGLRSLFSQLIANADDFIVRGVNIRQTIQERGLLGALDALRMLTGGTAEAVRQFIPDIEGQQAALTLLGSQYDKFIEVQGRLRTSQGSVSAALNEQNKTFSAGLKEVAGELDRYLQKFSEVVGRSLGASNGFLNATAGFIRSARESLEVRRTQFEAEEAFEESVSRSTAAVVSHTQAYKDQAGTAQQNIQVTEAFAKALQTERDNIQASETAIRAFGQKSQRELEQLADAAELNFAQIYEYGRETPQNLLKIWEETAKRIIAAYGTLTPGLRQLDEELRANAARTAVSIEESYKRLGVQTTATLQQEARRSLEAFQQILNAGTSTPEKLLEVWQRILKQITEAGFTTLPPGFQEIARRMQEIARKLAIELPKPFLDAFGKIDAAGKRVADEFEKKFDDTFKALATAGATNTRQLAASLTEAQIKAAFELGLISRHAYETALALKQAGTEGGQGLADGIAAGAARAQEDLRGVAEQARAIIGFTSFRDDLPGIVEQLREEQAFQRDLGLRTPYPGLFGSEELAAQRRTSEQAEEQLLIRLRQAFQSALDDSVQLSETLGQVSFAPGLLAAAQLLGADIQAITRQIEAAASGVSQFTTASDRLTTTTRETGEALQQQASGPVQSLGAGYITAAMGAQALIDRQRELLLLAGGSQITDAPGRGLPVGAGSGLASPGGASLLVPNGGSLPGGLSPADLGLSLTRPTQPSSLLLPVRVPVTPTSGRSPLLTGFPGATGTTAPLTGAASPVRSPVQDQSNPNARGPVIGGTLQGPDLSNIGQLPGGTRSINVTVNTMALTRGAAQDLAQNLAPALRELQRRGEI